MARNLRTLGLALAAVFALSAVAASGAMAAEEFHSNAPEKEGKVKTIVTGHSESKANGGWSVLKTNTGVELTCPTSTYEGTVEGATATQITVHPWYGADTEGNKCKAKIGAAELDATVDTNDCAYIFKAGPTTAGDAPIEIECPTGQAINITTELCDFTVGAQKPEGGVNYTNLETGGTKAEITIKATVKGIKFNKDETKPGGCTGTGTTATYTGNVIAKGYEDEGNTGTPETPLFMEGSQVHIWWE